MELIESEFDKMMEVNPEQSLHTQISETGYQPYGEMKVGSVAETNLYGPVARSRSSGSQQSSRSSSRVKRKGDESDPLESGSVALTAPEASQTGSSESRKKMFTDAEKRIVEKGLEVAAKAAELQKAEHEMKLMQQASMASWERTQQREEASKRMLIQGQRTQLEIEQVKTNVAAEVQQVQAQVASAKEGLMRDHVAVEAQIQRTSDVQAEVERQFAAKQQEIAEKEVRLAKEAEQIAKARAESDQRVAKVIAEFEGRSAAAQAQVEREREQRLSMESQLAEARRELQKKPQIFQMEKDDDMARGRAAQQVETDRLIAMGLAEETHRQREAANWPKCGNVALTTAAELKVTAEFQSPEESERDRESANKDPVQMLGAEMAQQQAMMLAMMQKIEGMTKEVDHLKQHSNRGSPHNSEGRRSPHSSDSECNLSLTSSLQDTLQRARGQRGPDSFRMQGSPVEGHTFASTQPAKGKELDEVKGIPAYPTTAEFAGWKRETRYAVAAASVQPEVALHHVMQAEKWTGDILSLPRRAEFQTLEVKFGKALKSTLRGDVRREVANLEERVLREQGRLLNGTEIYSWIVRQFKRDLKLARPQVLKEISLVKLGAGRNALRNFKAKWDAAVERLVDIGSSKESDQEILYMYFKDQFMQSDDMTDSVAKVNRSPASSSVHSYQWMYQAVEARLETMRLHTQEVERVAAYKVDSPSPMTPGVETVKGQGKSNPNRDTSKEACKRMLKEGKCEF